MRFRSLPRHRLLRRRHRAHPTAAGQRPGHATLWRDLILATWGADPLQCPCCKGTMRKVETLIQAEEIEKRREAMSSSLVRS